MASNKKAGKGSASDRAPRPRAKGTMTGAGAKKKLSAPAKRAGGSGTRSGKARPPRAGAKTAVPAGKTAVPVPAEKKAGPAGRSRVVRGKAARTAPAAPRRTGKAVAPAVRPAVARGRGAAVSARRKPAVIRKTEVEQPRPEAGLSEEDAIRSAKYTPRDLPPRLFEEERFLFPESYGVNRVRLLVRDPEWLFAYWDVSPAGMKEMGKSLGERTLAVSRLTLRITDPVSGGSSDVLLPPGARWWYVRADSTPRSYKAELGLTLPSGEFRRFAESNTVITPRVGPSPHRATKRMSYSQPGAFPLDPASAAGLEDARTAGSAPGPWSAPSIDGASGQGAPSPSAAGDPKKGGASDAFKPGGASDAFQPGGASDVHRR